MALAARAHRRATTGTPSPADASPSFTRLMAMRYRARSKRIRTVSTAMWRKVSGEVMLRPVHQRGTQEEPSCHPPSLPDSRSANMRPGSELFIVAPAVRADSHCPLNASHRDSICTIISSSFGEEQRACPMQDDVLWGFGHGSPPRGCFGKCRSGLVLPASAHILPPVGRKRLVTSDMMRTRPHNGRLHSPECLLSL